MDEQNYARTRGLAIFEEVYGPELARGIAAYAASGSFGSAQAAWTLDWSFGSVWAREGLERRMRSATVLGMLIGQGQTEEMRFHTRMALANGVTRAELEEIFLTAVPYCGFPAANSAKQAMLSVFAEIDAQD